jgi:nucleotide-binding universal stress UspA family protein
MWKKILLPIDFSEPFYDALKTAKKIALHFSAELIFIHVIPSFPPFSPPPKNEPNFNLAAYIKNLHTSAENSIQEVIKRKIGKELHTHIYVTHGDVASKISGFALKNNVDLIILASHGTAGWKKTYLGSVTEKLIRISSTPTLIIRKPIKNKR